MWTSRVNDLSVTDSVTFYFLWSLCVCDYHQLIKIWSIKLLLVN